MRVQKISVGVRGTWEEMLFLLILGKFSTTVPVFIIDFKQINTGLRLSKMEDLCHFHINSFSSFF